MNEKQRAKYGPHFTIVTDGNERHAEVSRASCHYCGFGRTARRGPGTNARAIAMRLFGVLAKHLRETHPDKLQPIDEEEES